MHILGIEPRLSGPKLYLISIKPPVSQDATSMAFAMTMNTTSTSDPLTSGYILVVSLLNQHRVEGILRIKLNCEHLY